MAEDVRMDIPPIIEVGGEVAGGLLMKAKDIVSSDEGERTSLNSGIIQEDIIVKVLFEVVLVDRISTTRKSIEVNFYTEAVYFTKLRESI